MEVHVQKGFYFWGRACDTESVQCWVRLGEKKSHINKALQRWHGLLVFPHSVWLGPDWSQSGLPWLMGVSLPTNAHQCSLHMPCQTRKKTFAVEFRMGFGSETVFQSVEYKKTNNHMNNIISLSSVQDVQAFYGLYTKGRDERWNTPLTDIQLHEIKSSCAGEMAAPAGPAPP